MNKPCEFDALFRMREDGDDLLGSHAGKPFQELFGGGASLQVFKKRFHRHASSSKNPRATNLTLDALNFLAITPIEHAHHVMLAPETTQEVLSMLLSRLQTAFPKGY